MAALLRVQAGGGVDAHGQENLIETAFRLAVQGLHGGDGVGQVTGIAVFLIGAVQDPGVAAGGVLLLGNPVVAALHAGVVKVGEVVVAGQGGVRGGELFRHGALDGVGPVHVRENLADGVEEHVGEDVVPPVAAVTAAQQGYFRAGVVHHNVPAVVRVEVVLGHLHKVEPMLVGLVNAVEAGTQQGVQDVQALMELSVVVVRALAGVLHGGVEAKSDLVYVPAGAVQPDHGTGGQLGVKVKGIGVKVHGLLLPVQDVVGLREGGHLLHARDGPLLDGGAPVRGSGAGQDQEAGHKEDAISHAGQSF